MCISVSLNQVSLQRGQRHMHQVMRRLGMQVEDKQFQQMINDTGVCTGVHIVLNLNDVFEGPP